MMAKRQIESSLNSGAMLDGTGGHVASMPTMLTVLIGILLNNARFSDVSSRLGELRSHMDLRFNGIERRFEEMKEMWRTELHRVEEVLDARLKHLEDR